MLIAVVFVAIFIFNSTALFSLNFNSTNTPVESIKLGVIIPLSGAMSYYGDYVPKGMALALDEINSSGGVRGQKLELVFEDSVGGAQAGVNAYNKLSAINDINYYIAQVSDVILGIAPIAEKEKKILVAMGSAATKISSAGDYIFRHNLLPLDETKKLADFIYNKKGIKEIAVLAVNAEAGVSYSSALKQTYEALDGKVISNEFYEKSGKDYKSVLLKLKSSGVQAVFAASYPVELGQILKQAKELDLNVQWFSMYSIEIPALLEIAGPSAEGLNYTHFYDVDSNSLKLKNFVNKYLSAYGVKPEYNAALAYDTVHVLAKAMSHCENPEDTVCVKDELYKIHDFSGITGAISFDENGDTRKEVFIKTVKDGKFVKLG
ncbi:MAG: ABC transporter substrate-binding protein [archaeon]